jgi:hypothetical protein
MQSRTRRGFKPRIRRSKSYRRLPRARSPVQLGLRLHPTGPTGRIRAVPVRLGSHRRADGAARDRAGDRCDLDRCSQACDDRSALVHGAHIDLRDAAERDAFTETMASLQSVLRAATRRVVRSKSPTSPRSLSTTRRSSRDGRRPTPRASDSPRWVGHRSADHHWPAPESGCSESSSGSG